MQHIGGALKKLIKTAGLEKGIAQQKALEIWPETVGKTVSKNTEPISIEHGILSIKTTTPVWRQELQFQKKQIIEKLNKKLNKTLIKDIRFI
jgi:predicted nucleic acid-binding Zn ribbon protein|tara:strand:- start:1538 stop:1813 length:276 start_codon:yes stop_codon:yes gene_type:complete